MLGKKSKTESTLARTQNPKFSLLYYHFHFCVTFPKQPIKTPYWSYFLFQSSQLHLKHNEQARL